jgi:DNA-binding NarL/FixJ family response regulator
VAEDTADHGTYCLRREVTCVLGPLALAQGDQALAWQQVKAVLPDGPGTVPGGAVLQDALLGQRLAAALCHEAGLLDEAAAWLRAHDQWLAWSGAVLGRAEGFAAWAHHWLVADDPARAQAFAEDAVAAASQPPQPLARLVSLRVRGETAAACGNADRAHEDFSSALALADACAAPYERALTLVALAQLRSMEERPTEASDALAAARAIAEQLGAGPILERINALATTLAPADRPPTHPRPARDQFQLTVRETEVLALLVTGRTNAEIAASLFLSPGTVRNHVSTILGKLGARTRTEAAALAHDHGLC